MRTPFLLRTTAFRVTLLILTVFILSSSLFLAYIYVATAGEVVRRADTMISRELLSLDAVFRRGGEPALNEAIIERSGYEKDLIYLLSRPNEGIISGTIARSPVSRRGNNRAFSENFFVTNISPDGSLERRPARAVEQQLPGGWRLLVGTDTSESQSYVDSIVRAVWGAGAIMIILGLAGGLFISRNVTKRLHALGQVIDSARLGNLSIRAVVNDAGDEFDLLADGLNEMLARLQRSMTGLRHAGDAIAHDLRSPLTRLRARLEASQLELRAGRTRPEAVLQRAIEDTDSVLRTFSTVLAISRLESDVEVLDQTRVSLSRTVVDIADLYEPSCEDKNVNFKREVAPAIYVRGHEEFITQAMSNLLDNAVKYTPEGGAITLRLRRRSSGDIEVSVTDTGPGIPLADRGRVVDRFVRLQSSRSAPGAGLGLSLVAAVMRAHGGELELDDGPADRCGLRATLVFPKAG